MTDDTRIDDSRGDEPPQVDPVRRDPRLSLRPVPLDGRVHDDGRPRRSPKAERVYQRSYKIGAVFGTALAVAVAVVLAGALAHAVWLTIMFGLWQ